eukprot:scaffold618_cov372-Prasinococcus_capsulatus_cf.AAC.15
MMSCQWQQYVLANCDRVRLAPTSPSDYYYRVNRSMDWHPAPEHPRHLRSIALRRRGASAVPARSPTM